MKHPGEAELALSISRDLGFLRGLVVRLHLGRCQRCRRRVAEFREAREGWKAANTVPPPDLDWERLNAEMTANIRLGLAAGRIVSGPAPKPRPYAPWRVVAAVASMAVLMLGGWYFRTPDSSASEPAIVADMWEWEPETAEMLLHADDSRIQIQKDGRGLALLHAGGDRVTLVVGMQGSMRAGYVDEETGEVTIHQIYAPVSDE
jgi:hypothetical protein